MPLKIDKEVCINANRSLALEWLDTNGTGAYASSTILGCHTRRYHGLLVARLAKPAGKFVLLSKLDDSLVLGDREHPLSVHAYPGILYPTGHRYLTGFDDTVAPTFTYDVGGAELTKQIALVAGRNTVLVRYEAADLRVGAKLRVKPLLAYRDHHALTRENMFMRVRTFPAREGFKIDPYEGLPPFFVQIQGRFEFFPAPTWYRNFEYHRDDRRGFAAHEDLFSPGVFEIELAAGKPVYLSASVDELPDRLGEMWDEEMDARRANDKALRGTALEKALLKTARKFFTVDPRGRPAVTAGYHWFLEWGRDAMISLPGLMSYNGETERYLETLRTFAAHRRHGLIPNFIGATEEANAYNSADASLWFAYAVQKYLELSKDHDGVKGAVWDALKDVFESYRRGTIHGIRMLPSGLIEAGTPEIQVTWMDAMVDGRPVTPRNGCAVELNALWYNLVCELAELGRRFKDPVADEAAALAPRVAAAFNEAFWIEAEGRLADVVNGAEVDASMRPNQIFAASLPYSPLEADRALSMLDAVRRELVTPLGLRTLSPGEPGYCGRYQGDPKARDTAYHNGTAWPWLLGHYGEALLRLTADKQAAINTLTRYLAVFEKHLDEEGLGAVSEVFDGDPPPTPGGCIAQAWSVAEILRLSKLIEREQKKLSRRTAR
jgi:predicted glycogen debranching enzyme